MRLINRNKGNKAIVSRAELFGSFIEVSSEGFFIFDSKLRSVEMNETALKLAGVDRKMTVGTSIKDLLPNMNSANRFEAFQELLRSGEPLRYRDYVQNSSDGNRLYDISAFKLGDGLGVVIIDVTEFENQAVSVNTQDDASLAIQTVMHNQFLVLDSSNRVISANKEFFNHFQLKQSAVLEELIYKLGDNQWDIAELHELLDHKLSQSGSVRDYEIQGYFGSLGERTLRINASCFFHETEGRMLIFLAIDDVTIVAKQRENLKKLSDIYANAPEPVLITDLRGTIVDLNDAACEFYGWSRAELTQNSFKSIIPPDSRDQYDNLLETVITARQVLDLETEHWSKQGDRLPISLSVVLLQNKSDENIGTVSYVKHIASQTLAEKALKKLYQKYLQGSDPLIVIDLQGNIMEANDAAEKLFGWSKASLTGKPGNLLVHEDDHKKLDSSLADCLSGKQVTDKKMLCVTKLGANCKVHFSMHQLNDVKDKINGIAIVANQVTDKQKVDRVLHQLLKHFMKIEDPVIVENLAGEVTNINAAASDLYGWKKNDIVGKLAKSVIPADQQKQTVELIQKVKSGGVVKNVESVRWSKTGVFYPVHLTMFLIHDADEIPQGIVTISKHLESAASSSVGGSFDMELLFRENCNPIVVEDMSGNVIDMNTVAEQMFGWKKSDLKGKPIKTIIPADQHKQHEKILLLSQNNVPINNVESKRWSKTGKVYFVSVSLLLLKDGDGNPTAVVNFTTDTTDLVNLRGEKQRLEKQLGHI